MESFIDELAAAAKQVPVAYRRGLLSKNPRAKAVLELGAEKAGWDQGLPKGGGRGVAVQFAFGSYMAQVADVEVGKEGDVLVRRVVCAVDCGTVVNPMNEAPIIEIHIVKSGEAPGGMGEPGTSALAPAVTNAIYAATGKRLRKLPVDGAQLKV